MDLKEVRQLIWKKLEQKKNRSTVRWDLDTHTEKKIWKLEIRTHQPKLFGSQYKKKWKDFGNCDIYL